MVASRAGHAHMALYLLRMGADIHAVDGVSESLLPTLPLR